MIEVELAVVGSGSGNAIVGREWAGRAVAIVDDAPAFGGTCLNRGCIPTKMLVHPADVIADVRGAGRLGVHGDATADWPAIQRRVFDRIDANAASSERWRVGQASVHVVRESVRLEDDRTLVTASGERIRFERLVITAGSRPRDLDGVDASLVHTSDTVMRIPVLPPRAVVVGGGAIAVELAHVLSAFGVEITIVVRGERVLGAEDEAVSTLVTELAAERWTLLRGRTVVGVESTSGDGRRVTLDDGMVIDTDLVVNATGRVPNADRLGADALFDVHDDGRLVTDARLRVLAGGVPVEHVFALGDVTSAHQLKHVANQQARVVRDNLRGEPTEDALGPIPQAIFGHPEVASFGTRGQDAGDAIVVTRDYGSTAYGWAMEDETSFARLVVDRGGSILGAHVVGPQASILLQPLVLAASEGRSVRGLARSLYWPHPALTEVIENALLDAEKELS